MAEKIIIAAVAANDVIGKDGMLPWHIPEDLKRFARLTSGHAVLMGRTTFQSLSEPLENRLNIVITRRHISRKTNVRRMASLDYALRWFDDKYEKLFIAGGEKIYAEGISLADAIELTRIHKAYEGDTYFPEIPNYYQETWREDHDNFSFIRYKRT